MASWFGDCYKNLNVLFTRNLSNNAAIMVNPGLVYLLVIESERNVPFWDSSKITYRSLYLELSATSVLAWKRGQPFSSATTKFIEFSKCLLGMSKR
ncbi:MAG: hypothetical protein K2L07_12440 [Lachnospiraceae bacterium]|nr:hypothetical protein [Lachnospiraceae bacterium]